METIEFALAVSGGAPLGRRPGLRRAVRECGIRAVGNLGAYMFEEYVQLPRTVAAIDAGLVDAETVLAGLARFDHNANEVVCVQLSRGFETNSRPFGEFFYNVADDNASVS